jgi:hypothetical protein
LDGAEEIFGQPLFPEQAELQDIRVLRDQLASPGDGPTQHLGEAETIAIIVRRQLSCFFVSDDRGAARLAAQNGVQVVGTWHLLKVAHRKGWMDADTFWGYVLTLEGQGRGAPAGVWDRSSFDKWRSPLRTADHRQSHGSGNRAGEGQRLLLLGARAPGTGTT